MKSIIRAKLRPVLTVLSIGFFLLITLATDVNYFLDTSTNTTVVIKNCESKAEVSGVLQITAIVQDSFGNPAPGVNGSVFIVHQKVRSDTCQFDVVFSLKRHFQTDANGAFVYEGTPWIHNNSQDLWRVEMQWGGNAQGVFPLPNQQVLVKYYSDSNFNFYAQQKPSL